MSPPRTVNSVPAVVSAVLISLLENMEVTTVYAKIPKFTVEYGTLLNDALINLGMTDAFDEGKADFSSLVEMENENIFISKVIHKTKIEVNEKGTKAGAVTAIEMECTCCEPQEPKSVYLDRPFFYMIIDTEQNLPIFMGSLMKVK
jgi:serpin B